MGIWERCKEVVGIMTDKIYKYVLKSVDEQTINLPQGYQILSVMNQFDKIVLYALVSDNKKYTEDVSIKIVETVHDIDFNTAEYKFLGTVSIYNGELMFHVFYRGD